MYWGRIHRMIFWELLKVFGLSLVALTGLILMGGVVAEATRNGLGPFQIAAVIPLLLPSLLPYTIPTTTLFATCIVYGRVSADNEIIALKSAGVHIIHVMWPAVLLGLVASALTMVLYLDAIPTTRFKMRIHPLGDIEELLYTMLRKEGMIRHPKIDVEIQVNSIQGKKLQDVIFLKRAPDGKGHAINARAKEAELRFDPASKQLLIHMFDCHGISDGQVFVADFHLFPIDLPPELNDANPVKTKPSDMTWLELFQHEEKLLRDQAVVSKEIDKHRFAQQLNNAEPHFNKHVENLLNERRNIDVQLAFTYSEWHMRPAIALGCLCFALVGCPIGIWFSKSDYLSAFITCFLPIVVIYYPILLGVINMTRAGRMNPWLGLYDADLLVLAVGGVLFHRLARN